MSKLSFSVLVTHLFLIHCLRILFSKLTLNKFPNTVLPHEVVQIHPYLQIRDNLFSASLLLTGEVQRPESWLALWWVGKSAAAPPNPENVLPLDDTGVGLQNMMDTTQPFVCMLAVRAYLANLLYLTCLDLQPHSCWSRRVSPMCRSAVFMSA
jgi:hypothetical protein